MSKKCHCKQIFFIIRMVNWILWNCHCNHKSPHMWHCNWCHCMISKAGTDWDTGLVEPGSRWIFVSVYGHYRYILGFSRYKKPVSGSDLPIHNLWFGPNLSPVCQKMPQVISYYQGHFLTNWTLDDISVKTCRNWTKYGLLKSSPRRDHSAAFFVTKMRAVFS